MRLPLAEWAGLATTLLHLDSNSATPSSYPTNGCTNVAQRQEWRTLSDEGKASYISAVKCLTTMPSILGLNTSRYSDFPYAHSVLNNEIHFVAEFLPWHRNFVQLYETALRDECGFEGRMPYWDWTLDSGGHFLESPLFSNSTTTGFGGSGDGGFSNPNRPDPLTSCVPDGAFANFTVDYFLDDLRPHCLNRGFSDGHTGDPVMNANFSAVSYSSVTVANLTANSTDFKTFTNQLENMPHGVIHLTIGGDMFPKTSPNEPLFFLHHTQIDRLWWKWQQIDPEARNVDFEGIRISRNGTAMTEPATMNDVMPYLGLGPDITVERAMTTQNDLLCYEYV